MATINLLPGAKRPKSSGLGAGGVKKPEIKFDFSALKPIFSQNSLAVPVLIGGGILVFAWLALQANVSLKAREVESLNNKIISLKTGAQDINTLKAKKSKLTENFVLYENFLRNNTSWAQKLYQLNKLLPAQVWLTQVYLEPKPEKMLVIKGKATSLLEKDIIDSIGKFTSSLKNNGYFNGDFSEIKLGSLESEKSGNFTFMRFVLFCKYKNADK